jgi:hypothetical protein
MKLNTKCICCFLLHERSSTGGVASSLMTLETRHCWPGGQPQPAAYQNIGLAALARHAAGMAARPRPYSGENNAKYRRHRRRVWRQAAKASGVAAKLTSAAAENAAAGCG